MEERWASLDSLDDDDDCYDFDDDTEMLLPISNKYLS